MPQPLVTRRSLDEDAVPTGLPAPRDAPRPDGSGYADWPHGAGPACPARLPDGSALPRVVVFLLEGEAGSGFPGEQDAALKSIARQGYSNLETVPLGLDPAGGWTGLADAFEANSADFLMLLRQGDMLAPGALAALVLAAWREGAEAVAGLRVVHGDRVTHLDILSSPAGPLRGAEGRAAGTPSLGVPFGCGDLLLSIPAIARAGGIARHSDDPVGELWPRLARSGARLARIGRPVLLQRDATAATSPPRRLRIAAVNDAGPSGGGAAIAHRRLIEALRFGGHEVTVHALNREAPPAGAEWSDAFPETEAAIRAEQPDLVLAGNIHGATRTSAILVRLGEQAPVAAMLHDLFLLTGRCAHPDGCTRIAAGCDALCPTPDFYPQLAPDRIAGVFHRKRAALTGPGAPTLMAASDWTQAQAHTLGPPGVGVARVEMAFPTQVFRPGDKRALRRRLGLPPADILIVFVAVVADQPNKGGPDLVRALAQVARPGIGFVALGRIDDPGRFRLPNLTAPGPIADEEELAAWYAACDLHVTASRLETLGQTPIEAGLCGVPTVAYRATGLTTAVIDGVSGLLVDPDPDALATAVTALVANPERLRALSQWGRIALEGRNSHAAAYLGLHEMLVKRGLVPGDADRIVLTAETLGTFAGTAAPLPGARGGIARSPDALVRLARLLKQRIWGRAQPLWMRRGVYLAARARLAARRVLRGS